MWLNAVRSLPCRLLRKSLQQISEVCVLPANKNQLTFPRCPELMPLIDMPPIFRMVILHGNRSDNVRFAWDLEPVGMVCDMFKSSEQFFCIIQMKKTALPLLLRYVRFGGLYCRTVASVLHETFPLMLSGSSFIQLCNGRCRSLSSRIRFMHIIWCCQTPPHCSILVLLTFLSKPAVSYHSFDLFASIRTFVPCAEVLCS